MARPIEPTPVLKGQDAQELRKQVERNQPTPTTRLYLERCERLYDELQSRKKDSWK